MNGPSEERDMEADESVCVRFLENHRGPYVDVLLAKIGRHYIQALRSSNEAIRSSNEERDKLKSEVERLRAENEQFKESARRRSELALRYIETYNHSTNASPRKAFPTPEGQG